MKTILALFLAVFAMTSNVQAAILFKAVSSNSVVTQVGVTPSIIASTTGVTGSGGSTVLSINRPGGVLAGRVLLAQITVHGLQTITAPAGWRLASTAATSGGQLTQSVYWLTEMAVEPGSYAWAFSSTARASGSILALDSVDPVSPVEVIGSTQANNTSSLTLPNITTLSVNSMLVAFLGSARAGTHTTATGMNEVYDVGTGAGPNGVVSSGNTSLKVAPGTTGVRSFTVLSGAADAIAHLLALRTTGSLTIKVPTGTVDGDVMIASVVFRSCSGSSGAACILNTVHPAGWTLVNSITDQRTGGGIGNRTFVYSRVAYAEPVSYTWFFYGGLQHSGAAGGILSFSGVDPVNPIHVEAGQLTNGSSHSAPSVTTTTPGTMLVSTHTVNSSGHWTPPASMTERVDLSSRTAPNDLGVSIGINTQDVAAAATIVAKTATLTNPPVGDTGIAHILALKPLATSVDHIRMEHTGSGVTCSPSTIILKACRDAACSAVSTTSETVTLSGTGWSTNPVTFTGSTTVELSKTTPQNVTLGVTSSAPATLSLHDCFNGVAMNTTTACQHSFAETGFIFSTIPDQTSGTPSGTLTLQAVKKSDSTQACEPLFTGSKTIEMGFMCVDPTTCAGKQAQINASFIASNPATGILAYSPVTLDFGANSTASFTIEYADVGKISLGARFLLSGTDFLTGNSNVFVEKPAGFTISQIKNTSTGAANPGVSTPSGSVFAAAGEDFTVTVTAVNAKGAATPNFGKEIIPQGIRLTPVIVAPAGGNNPALLNDTVAGVAFVNGAATVTNLGWEEVGAITITPDMGGIQDYLGAGNITGSPSTTIGRFKAHDLSLSSPSIATRVDLNSGSGCSPVSAFTYMDEPFKIGLTLTARSLQNSTLKNYDSGLGWSKLDGSTVNWMNMGTSPSMGAGSINDPFNLTGQKTPLTPRLAQHTTPSIGSWNAGVGNFTGFLKIQKGAVPDGIYSKVHIGLAPTDADGATVLPASLTMDADQDGTSERQDLGFEADIRYGRMRMINAHGSELLVLPVTSVVQVYKTTGFTQNTEDNCTPLAVPTTGNSGLIFYPLSSANQLLTGSTIANMGGVFSGSATVLGGDARLSLSAPGAGHFGFMDVKLVPPAYLQFDWNSLTAGLETPQARASFGMAKRPTLLYRRELY